MWQICHGGQSKWTYWGPAWRMDSCRLRCRRSGWSLFAAAAAGSAVWPADGDRRRNSWTGSGRSTAARTLSVEKNKKSRKLNWHSFPGLTCVKFTFLFHFLSWAHKQTHWFGCEETDKLVESSLNPIWLTINLVSLLSDSWTIVYLNGENRIPAW